MSGVLRAEGRVKIDGFPWFLTFTKVMEIRACFVRLVSNTHDDGVSARRQGFPVPAIRDGAFRSVCSADCAGTHRCADIIAGSGLYWAGI